MYEKKVLIFLVLGCLGIFGVFGFAVLMRLTHKPKQKRSGAHGFEVKLNTGQMPVIEKKENDHG